MLCGLFAPQRELHVITHRPSQSVQHNPSELSILLLPKNPIVGELVMIQAGGFFGIFTAIIAWYVAIASLVTAENSYFVLPVGPLNKRR